jgi:hypothetical protein
MYVLVSNEAVAVYEADDCTSLEVRMDAGEDSSALAAAGLGQWDGAGEIDLTVARLHSLVRSAATVPDWERRWTAMIAYAARSGWLAHDGSTVRAHVVSV